MTIKYNIYRQITNVKDALHALNTWPSDVNNPIKSLYQNIIAYKVLSCLELFY
jgi:hypothetical protein